MRSNTRVVVLQPEDPQRVDERFPRDDGEILIAPHQRTQPGIFELLDPPDLGDDLAVSGKCLFGDGGHRLNVVERAIGIENNGLDGHGCLFLLMSTPSFDRRRRQIPKSFRALAFSTFGLISSRISSLAKSASQRSGVITGQSEPNSILSCKMELM